MSDPAMKPDDRPTPAEVPRIVVSPDIALAAKAAGGAKLVDVEGNCWLVLKPESVEERRARALKALDEVDPAVLSLPATEPTYTLEEIREGRGPDPRANREAA